MKSFNEWMEVNHGKFLVEISKNGSIFMAVSKAFNKIRRLNKEPLGLNREAWLEILDEIFDEFKIVKMNYGYNMDPKNSDAWGADETTIKLGEPFFRAYNYIDQLRNKIVKDNSINVKELINKAMNDLEKDYNLVTSLMVTKAQ